MKKIHDQLLTTYCYNLHCWVSIVVSDQFLVSVSIQKYGFCLTNRVFAKNWLTYRWFVKNEVLQWCITPTDKTDRNPAEIKLYYTLNYEQIIQMNSLNSASYDRYPHSIWCCGRRPEENVGPFEAADKVKAVQFRGFLVIISNGNKRFKACRRNTNHYNCLTFGVYQCLLGENHQEFSALLTETFVNFECSNEDGFQLFVWATCFRNFLTSLKSKNLH